MSVLSPRTLLSVPGVQRQELKRLRGLLAPLASAPPLPRPADPAATLAGAGYPPDPWQAEVLRSHASRLLLLCSRQAGKSTVVSALALNQALYTPHALVLLLSPTLRQSGELFRDKVLRLYNTLGRPVPAAQESALQLTLANGSRIVSLPENEAGIRCFSAVSLLVIDEAARVSEELYRAVRPMLAVSGGRLAALSTPFGRQGWFFEAWQGAENWHRVKASAADCPRITREFLAEERAGLGERWFRQEYFCSFEDVVGAVFSGEEIAAMFADPSVTPMPPLAAREPAGGLGPLYSMGEL